MEIMGFIVFVLAIAFLYLWYRMAKKDTVIGVIMRTIWNFWFVVMSIIPIVGWFTSRLIIATDETEENARRAVIGSSAIERQKLAGDMADNAQRSLDEERARKRAEEESMREKDVEVYKEHYHDGWVDRENLKVNSTGDMYYDPADGQWHKII